MYVFSMSKNDVDNGYFRAMLTVIQSKSAFASLTVLEPPLLFNLAQIKPFVVILLYTDTKSNNNKYQFKS